MLKEQRPTERIGWSTYLMSSLLMCRMVIFIFYIYWLGWAEEKVRRDVLTNLGLYHLSVSGRWLPLHTPGVAALWYSTARYTLVWIILRKSVGPWNAIVLQCTDEVNIVPTGIVCSLKFDFAFYPPTKYPEAKSLPSKNHAPICFYLLAKRDKWLISSGD